MSFNFCYLVEYEATGAGKPINSSSPPSTLFYNAITWLRKGEQAFGLRHLVSLPFDPTGILTVLTSIDTMWTDKLESACEEGEYHHVYYAIHASRPKKYKI
jgi:hypothetical protein